MKKSITAKLFILTAILLSLFLLFTLLFQLMFFEKFYMKATENNISKNMTEFANEYTACNEDQKGAVDLIGRFEQKNDAVLILFDSEMNPLLIAEDEDNINLIDKNALIEKLQDFSISVKGGNSNEPFRITLTQHDAGQNDTFLTYYISSYPVGGNYTAYVLYTQKEMTEARDATFALYKYFIGASVVVILLLSVFYARLIARPLVKLNKAAAKMSELDFTQEIKAKSDDEIGRLGDTLNFLSQNLSTALCNLEEANAKLQGDVDKEKQLNKMRKDFIATVSHELKTPLALIKGYAQAFRDHIVTEDSTDYYSEVILDETDKMSDLITRMLELTELESDYVKVNEDKFCISALTDHIVKKFSPLAAAKIIGIKSGLSGTLLVCADRMKIEQVIENLLTNAIKHTPDSGTISIYAEYDAGNIVYSIENSGSHVPEEEIDSIWDMFYRGKQNGRKDGSGLGLAIVKKIFELQNIKYGVRNTETGVCFFFVIERIHSTPIK